jgi:hypothetical protein
VAIVRIIEQYPENKPPCPQSGIGGGPIYPAHAVEITIADRVYAATPRDSDGEILPEFESVAMAASSRSGMELYRTEASPRHPGPNYYTATFFQCLVCGFVLPAQAIPR